MASNRRKPGFLKRVATAWNAARAAMADEPRGRSYAGTEVGRLTADWGFLATIKSADEEIRGNIRLARARSRELCRNNSYMHKFLEILENNVIGPNGIRSMAKNLLPSGKANDPVNRVLDKAYVQYSKTRVTVDGQLNLQDARNLGIRTVAQDGEALFRLIRGFERNPHGLAIQAIDADLLDDTYVVNKSGGQNEIRMGVEVDEWGAPVRYWFRDRPTFGGGAATGPRYAVPAEDIIHVFKRERVNQTRGMPWCMPVMMATHMMEGYEEAEAVAARKGAMTNIFYETVGDGIVTEEKPVEMELAPGQDRALPAGWRANMVAPTHPSSTFPDFIRTQGRKIATGLSVFYNILFNDATDTSYSTGRMFQLAMMDDWRKVQGLWISQFEERLYQEWLKMAMLTGAVKLGGYDILKFGVVDFFPRGWDWVDPQKDLASKEIELDRFLTSPQRICAERGELFEDILDEVAAAREMAAARGIDLTAATRKPATPTPPDQPPTPPQPNGNGNGAKRMVSVN